MATSPSLCNKPKISDLSPARVPRPHLPFKRRCPDFRATVAIFAGCPLCPATMYTSSPSILPLNFVDYFWHNAFMQLCCHLLHNTLRQIQFYRNLPIGKIQTHQIQAQHPSLQRLMMTFKYRITQIIKLLSTSLTFIPLLMGLGCMKAAFVDFTGSTFRALDLSSDRRKSRMISKHFASSTSCCMLTIPESCKI